MKRRCLILLMLMFSTALAQVTREELENYTLRLRQEGFFNLRPTEQHSMMREQMQNIAAHSTPAQQSLLLPVPLPNHPLRVEEELPVWYLAIMFGNTLQEAVAFARTTETSGRTATPSISHLLYCNTHEMLLWSAQAVPTPLELRDTFVGSLSTQGYSYTPLDGYNDYKRGTLGSENLRQVYDDLVKDPTWTLDSIKSLVRESFQGVFADDSYLQRLEGSRDKREALELLYSFRDERAARTFIELFHVRNAQEELIGIWYTVGLLNEGFDGTALIWCTYWR